MRCSCSDIPPAELPGRPGGRPPPGKAMVSARRDGMRESFGVEVWVGGVSEGGKANKVVLEATELRVEEVKG